MHRLVLMGSLTLESPGGDVKKLPPGRPTELLGFLASRTGSVARSEVAAALWPDESEAAARQNLRQTLLALRSLLGDAPLLVADRHTISLNHDLLETDVGKIWEMGKVSLSSLQVDTGTFLRGIDAEWVIEERRRLSRRVVDLALRAASDRAHLPIQAAAYADIAVSVEPLMEAPRVIKVRAALASGNRALAELEIDRYEEELSECGLQPGPELRALLHADQTEEADEAGSPSQRLALATARAPFLLARGLAFRARSTLDKSIKESRGATPADLSCAHAALSLVLLHEGNYEGAMLAAKQAKDLADGPVTRARALTSLARSYNGAGRASRALVCAQSGIREAEKAGDDATLGVLLTAAAMARAIRHEPEEAETLLRRAVPLAHASGDRLLSARIQHLLGHVLTQTCGLEAASRAFQAAREALDERRHPQMAVLIKLDLARLQEEAGHAGVAKATYEEAISEARALSDTRSLTQGLTYLADLESSAGQYEDAYGHHSEAVGLRRVSGDRLGLATSLRGLGRAAWGLGRSDEAHKLLSEAIGLCLAVSDRKNLGRARVLLAHTLERDRPEVARNVVQQALRDLSAVNGSSDTSPGQDPIYTLSAGMALSERLGDRSPAKSTGFGKDQSENRAF